MKSNPNLLNDKSGKIKHFLGKKNPIGGGTKSIDNKVSEVNVNFDNDTA